MLKQILCSAVFFLGLTTLSAQYKDCYGCSTPKDQWIHQRVYDPQTQSFWKNMDVESDPNISLPIGNQVPFEWPGLGVIWTDQATPQFNCPWLLIGRFWNDSLGQPLLLNNSNYPHPAVNVGKHTSLPALRQMGFFESLTGNQCFLLYLLACLLLFLLFLRYQKRIKKENKLKEVAKEAEENAWRKLSPTESGPKMVPGGVNETTALLALKRQAQELHPNEKFEVIDLLPGRLFNFGDVYFAGQKTAEKRYMGPEGERAFAATIKFNEEKKDSKKIYCLQGCGNDARKGNFLAGENLTFVPDLVVPTPVATNMNTADSQPETTGNTDQSDVQASNSNPYQFAFAVIEELFKSNSNGRVMFEMGAGSQISIIIEKNGPEELH